MSSNNISIPFLDLRDTYLRLKEELKEAVHRVLNSGWYLLGEEVQRFEEEFAVYCEASHCVCVGSGLDALHLILRAHGIGSGDEVIVPSNTYIATWLAVTHAGAIPVPVEPEERTYNIDPAHIKEAINQFSNELIESVPVIFFAKIGRKINSDIWRTVRLSLIHI